MRNDRTYRAGFIAYCSITVLVTLGTIYLLLAFRFERGVHELGNVVKKNRDIWRQISVMSLNLSSFSEKGEVPVHVHRVLNARLKALIAESHLLDEREHRLLEALKAQWYSIGYRQRLARIANEDIKPSVRNYLDRLSVTSSNLLAARYSSMEPVDAILLASGAALDPLREKHKALDRLLKGMMDNRLPAIFFILAILQITIWSSWFALLRPKIKLAALRQEQIAAAEKRSRVTLRSIGDGVVVTDAQGRLETLNPAAEKILGHQLARLQGHPIGEVLRLVRSADGGEVTNPAEEVLRTGQVDECPDGTSLRNSSGELRTISYAAAPIHCREDIVDGVVFVFRDITEENALKENLRRSDKLRAIGMLSGGMAHEFNNALAIISGAFEMIKSALARDDHTMSARYIEIVDQAVKRSSALTNRLLALARKSEISLAPVDLLKIVENAVEVLRRTSDRNILIDIECELDQSRRRVLGDASALEGLFINLGLNSIQAIDGPGRVGVTLLASRPLAGAAGTANGFVKVVWTDDGHGIAHEDMKQIFEPFFTKRSEQGGSGLGLSVIQSTVATHSGDIEVESEPGKGSTFTIHLPLTEQPLPNYASVTGQDSAVSDRRILVVDDEKDFLEIMTGYLSALGYRTLAASTDSEAVSLFRRFKGEIDLVVLDMNLPGLSGPEIAERIHEVRPDCSIIVATGFSKVDFQKWDPARMTYMKKPFELKDLAAAIANLLERSETHG
ncbi:MAG: ATP-binding protein [Hyphomicrobiaceae bacterium]